MFKQNNSLAGFSGRLSGAGEKHSIGRFSISPPGPPTEKKSPRRPDAGVIYQIN
ncbi:hypothetical protein [Arthrobacter sp. R-11]|uniref:hypothetical protein n=1 Tax=Arthrobacter sp. R-11 TaxID=3404053 RepID=UPI003CE9B540